MTLVENLTCKDTAVDQDDTLQTFRTLSFSTIAIMGTLGNLLVCFALYVDRKTKKVSYLLIWHLAFVDLLACSVILPSTIFYVYDKFSKLCDVYLALTGIVPGISIHYQCYVSINRYCLVAKPLHFYQRWFSHRVTLVTLALIVIVNISSTLAVYGIVSPSLNKTLSCGCFEVHGDQRQWNFNILSLNSVLAFMVGICFYVKLLRYVRCGVLTGISAREMQTSRILAGLFIAYFISMILSPVLLYITKKHHAGEWFRVSSQILVTINYAVNPIVYGISVFKHTFLRAFSRCFSSNRITTIP